MGSVLETDDLNMLPKNLIPEDPPGMDPIIIHMRAMTCATAQTMVSGVLCKCSAQYNVARSVDPYRVVDRALSLEKSDFKCAHGPHRKLKLNIKNRLPNVKRSANFLACSSRRGM